MLYSDVYSSHVILMQFNSFATLNSSCMQVVLQCKLTDELSFSVASSLQGTVVEGDPNKVLVCLGMPGDNLVILLAGDDREDFNTAGDDFDGFFATRFSFNSSTVSFKLLMIPGKPKINKEFVRPNAYAILLTT